MPQLNNLLLIFVISLTLSFSFDISNDDPSLTSSDEYILVPNLDMCGGDITMEYVPTYEQALAKVKQFINNDPSKCGTIVNYTYQYAAHLKDPRKTHP
jgi:hypothetical protein